MSKTQLTPKIARWALFLEDFNYEIVHRSDSSRASTSTLPCLYSMEIKLAEVSSCSQNGRCSIPAGGARTLSSLPADVTSHDFALKSSMASDGIYA
ncbi:hypothetical protein AVEN_19712-1 [Araneus ventricosus]|uniref:Reverse transcriptase RNase H-like domain-containing protein n=1 Tax=Araneus ventricosus TaxID=182803 RepID=A0A4Y2C3I6_ARAVE|nr:hypothetical protein AVEN_19712-1 [Araneus ventricosus]